MRYSEWWVSDDREYYFDWYEPDLMWVKDFGEAAYSVAWKEQQTTINKLHTALNTIMNEFCEDPITPYQEEICTTAIKVMNNREDK